jgi:hypothetical protein
MTMKERKSSTADIVVFSISRETECSECGTELWQGDFLKKEGEKALCLSCADLDRWVYLGRGDATLTRWASKYSSLRAVVVRFSKARQRYERQGILVEETALHKAEQECLADADVRARRQERDEARRAQVDVGYVDQFAQQVLARYSYCPVVEASAIAEHTCRKYSGRVGRSAAAKAFDPEAIDLAVVAHVRHRHTHYDELLMSDWERHDARAAVAPTIQQVLHEWRGSSDL